MKVYAVVSCTDYPEFIPCKPLVGLFYKDLKKAEGDLAVIIEDIKCGLSDNSYYSYDKNTREFEFVDMDRNHRGTARIVESDLY